jgi:hypothetical protein
MIRVKKAKYDKMTVKKSKMVPNQIYIHKIILEVRIGLGKIGVLQIVNSQRQKKWKDQNLKSI